jgi:hypothetical protein
MHPVVLGQQRWGRTRPARVDEPAGAVELGDQPPSVPEGQVLEVGPALRESRIVNGERPGGRECAGGVQCCGVLRPPVGDVPVAVEVDCSQTIVAYGEFGRQGQHVLLHAQLGGEEGGPLDDSGGQRPKDKGEENHVLHDLGTELHGAPGQPTSELVGLDRDPVEGGVEPGHRRNECGHQQPLSRREALGRGAGSDKSAAQPADLLGARRRQIRVRARKGDGHMRYSVRDEPYGRRCARLFARSSCGEGAGACVHRPRVAIVGIGPKLARKACPVTTCYLGTCGTPIGSKARCRSCPTSRLTRSQSGRANGSGRMHESVGWGVAERHNAGAEPLRVDQFKRQRGLAVVEQALPVAYENRPMTHIYAGGPRFFTAHASTS